MVASLPHWIELGLKVELWTSSSYHRKSVQCSSLDPNDATLEMATGVRERWRHLQLAGGIHARKINAERKAQIFGHGGQITPLHACGSIDTGVEKLIIC